MTRPRRIAWMVGTVLVVAACGGGGAGDTAPPTGTDATTATTVGPTTTGGGNPDTTGTPGTTVQPPSGNEEAVTVEIDGETFQLSVRDDIEMPGAPGQMVPTRCEPDFFGDMFWVGAVAVGSDGALISGTGLQLTLFPDGTFDDAGFVFSDQGRDYRLVEDDPGSWTVAGNRIHGDVNVSYDVGGQARQTTARFDVTCPD